MKKLKRLKLNQLFALHDLSESEMEMFWGGAGCCWEVLAELFRNMYPSEAVDPKHKDNGVFSPSSFEKAWREYMGDACTENGDPTTNQVQDLFDFIQGIEGLDTTTASGFETNGYSTMLSSSGSNNWGQRQLGFGIMDGGNGNMHAVMMKGYNTDVNGNKTYTIWDPESGCEYTVSEGAIKMATGIHREN